MIIQMNNIQKAAHIQIIEILDTVMEEDSEMKIEHMVVHTIIIEDLQIIMILIMVNQQEMW